VWHWGCTESDIVSNSSKGDLLAKESIWRYFFVDYGKRDADHSSGDPPGESGEEQSKVMKLQHRERMRRTGTTLAWGSLQQI